MVRGRAYARPHAQNGARCPKDGARRCSRLDVRDYGWNLRVIAEPIVRRHPGPITPTLGTAFSIALDVRAYRLVIVEPRIASLHGWPVIAIASDVRAYRTI